MLAIRERTPVYYHKDTKQFDRFPYSKTENMNPNALLPFGSDRNTIMLPTLHELNLYEEFIDACGDIYIQIFDEWAEKNDLSFATGDSHCKG